MAPRRRSTDGCRAHGQRRDHRRHGHDREPGSGTDLQNIRTRAERAGDGYRIHGAKTFCITNGSIGDLLVLAVKTDPAERAKGVSLFLFETSTPGFRVGQAGWKKIGLHGSDTL